MASNAVDICNLALGRVKGDVIDSLDEDSTEAEHCDRLYEDRRDTLVTSFAWRFARATKALTIKTGESSDEWLYVYDYPNDCLRVHYIIPPESGKNIVAGTGIATPRIDYEPIPYDIMAGDDGSRRIHTDYEDAHINYTKQIEAVSLMDPLFTDALAWFIAIDLAIVLGGDSGKRYRESAIEGFDRSIGNAAAHAGNEKEDGRQRLPRAIQARHGAVDRDYFYGDLAYRRF